MQPATATKPRRNRNVRIIEDFPALVRDTYRYDTQRRAWLARSWTDPNREYEVHYRISGTVLCTTCECQGASDGRWMCKHQLGIPTVLLPEVSPGAVITKHITMSRARFQLGAAA